jgi:hypothetical protein
MYVFKSAINRFWEILCGTYHICFVCSIIINIIINIYIIIIIIIFSFEIYDFYIFGLNFISNLSQFI